MVTGFLDFFLFAFTSNLLAVGGLLALNLALATWRAEVGFETDTGFYFGVSRQPAFEV